MSHIDEGELTAYADGAYAPEDTDAQRIAMHIAECANCRNRLAEAQRLSGRASEILAVAAPASLEAPPFEHIAASVPRRTRSRTIPLTWAASIVLAAGLGWFGRDALHDPDAGLRMTARQAVGDSNVLTSPAPVSEAAPARATPGAGAGVSARAGADAGERARVLRSSPSETDRVAEDAAASDLSSEPGVGRAAGSVASQAVADAAGEPQPMAKVAAAPAPTTTASPSAGAPSAGARSAAAPPAAPPEASARRLEARTQSMAAAEMAEESIEYITPAEAEARKLKLYIIPSLEVVRIGLIGSGMRVEQKLPDGKIVTLETERTAGYRQQMDAANAAKTAEGAKAPVSVMRAGTRVTITGALPADSLRALGARIR